MCRIIWVLLKMALDLTKNKEIFKQRDVRETAVAVVGTTYYSVNPINWKATNPNTDDITLNRFQVQMQGNDIVMNCAINLPHGAVVTSCVVYGNAAATAETWNLQRISVITDSVSDALATANIGTANTSISNATVDNQNYSYEINTSSMDTADEIWGTAITYTI